MPCAWLSTGCLPPSFYRGSRWRCEPVGLAASVRGGPELDRLARSVPDARAIADQFQERCVRLALGPTLYDPGDPVGRMFFNILATFAGFGADLFRLRTREGMATDRAKGKLCGKQPKLSGRQ